MKLKIQFKNKPLFLLLIAVFTLVITNCSKHKKIDEGTIEYAITYPCLEKSNNSLMFFLPKKMIMTFKDNCFKNKFIFSNPNSKLEAISDCNKKEITLAFGYGKNMKFTKLDSTNIEVLLNDLPKYSRLNNETDSIVFLDNKSLSFHTISSKSDSVFNTVTTKEIAIKNINWCTPFYEIDDVMLEYNLIQYGIEMKFKAEKISSYKINEDFLKIDDGYEFLGIKKYLKEVKTILSIFSCN